MRVGVFHLVGVDTDSCLEKQPGAVLVFLPVLFYNVIGDLGVFTFLRKSNGDAVLRYFAF